MDTVSSAEATQVEELESKLEEHRAQLTQVRQLLEMTPEDETLLQLLNDLEQVVALTEDLATIKTNVPAPVAAPSIMESVAPPPLPARTYDVGERVMALYDDGKPYVARVDAQTQAGHYTVTFLEYGTSSDIPDSSMTPFTPVMESSLTRGTKIKAIWHEDGMFYDALIDSPGSGTGLFMVKYMGFNKKRKFEVGILDIIIREDQEAKKKISDKFEVPDTLKPDPSDTETERLKKRKSIKRLKNEWRRERNDMLGKKRQNAWLDFRAGHSKRSKFVKQKESMFAAPKSVDGKVGVVGSGRGITAFHNVRKGTNIAYDDNQRF